MPTTAIGPHHVYAHTDVAHLKRVSNATLSRVVCYTRGMPNVVILAGPNGAGKSTLAPGLVHELLGIEIYVNADVIARGIAAFNPDRAAFQAGRLMLQILDGLAAQGTDFAFETTLASRTFAPWIATQKERGYRFHLAYVWVPSADICVARVAGRVRAGGHDIPLDVIRRRYAGGLRNFFELYLPIADSWSVYDNQSGEAVRLIAEGSRGSTERVQDQAAWEAMQRRYRDGA